MRSIEIKTRVLRRLLGARGLARSKLRRLDSG